MKKYLRLVLIVTMIISIGNIMLYAQDTGDTKTPRKFKASVSAGVLVYAGIGPSSVSTDFYKIKFALGAFKPGFTGGVEGFFFPSKKHAISIGAFYDQRKINVKIADIIIASAVTSISMPTFMGLPNLTGMFVLPIEELVKSTDLALDYINLPVTYRFHFGKVLYAGMGIDIGLLLRASAKFNILILESSLDLKGSFNSIDFGGHVVGGIIFKGFFFEFIAGGSFLDIDKLSGTRRSVYMKTMVGYRI